MSKNSEIILTDSAVDFLKEEIGGGGATPLEVSNVESLTNEQCSNLNCGDTVIQNSKVGTRSNYKYYVVVAKNDTVMTLVNSSADAVNSVKYRKVRFNWTYEETSTSNIGELQLADIFETSGTLENIVTFYRFGDRILTCVNYTEEHDATIYEYASALDSEGHYLLMTITQTENEGEIENTYTITQETSEGGKFVEIDREATTIDQETLEKLVDFNNRTLKPNFIVLTTKGPTHNLPILMPSDNSQCVYRSAVMDGKYWQLKVTPMEVGANVTIEQVSVGGGGGQGGGIDNLCDYYPDLARINGQQMFNYGTEYLLDVDAFVQYVEDSGVGDIPFEPNLEGTESSGIWLITTKGDGINGITVSLQNQTLESNSSLHIQFTGPSEAGVNDLSNEEGDTLIEFLTRNKDAIKEVFNEVFFSGAEIISMFNDMYGNNDMCICMSWMYDTTSPKYVHSMNLIKFLEVFKPIREE